MYNCKHCGTLVTLEHRAHTCTVGKISYRVYYNPNVSKSNKQSTIPSYMKRFGSKSDVKIQIVKRVQEKHYAKLGISIPS